MVEGLEVAAFTLGLTDHELLADQELREAVQEQAGLTGVHVRKEQWRDVAPKLRARNEDAARVHARGKASHCRACGAAIWWGETETGSRMPLDPLPRPRGNVIRIPQGRRMVLRVLGQGDLPVVGRPAYQSHYASCPFGDQMRRRRERREQHADDSGRVALCKDCGRVMDPWLPAQGYSSHINCDPFDRGSEG